MQSLETEISPLRTSARKSTFLASFKLNKSARSFALYFAPVSRSCVLNSSFSISFANISGSRSVGFVFGLRAASNFERTVDLKSPPTDGGATSFLTGVVVVVAIEESLVLRRLDSLPVVEVEDFGCIVGDRLGKGELCSGLDVGESLVSATLTLLRLLVGPGENPTPLGVSIVSSSL